MENKVIKEIDNLLSLIEQYQLKDVHPQVNTLKELQYSLNHHIKLSTREKINIHHALFIPRGGLSELYYMDANVEQMKFVNEQLSHAIDTIGKFLITDLSISFKKQWFATRRIMALITVKSGLDSHFLL